MVRVQCQPEGLEAVDRPGADELDREGRVHHRRSMAHRTHRQLNWGDGVPILAPMDRYDWLLLGHIAGVFMVAAGLVLLTVAVLAASRRERPSDVALLLGLIRRNDVLFSAGGGIILLFGIILVLDLDEDYSFGDGWIIGALVLWLVTAITGVRAGRVYGGAHETAVRLASDGDRPSPELAAMLRDRGALLMHALSVAAILAAVVLMIYKPGA